MSADVLLEFRRPGAVVRERHDDAPGYEAFGVANGAAKPLRLDIRLKAGFAVARAYTSFTEIQYDRASYMAIILVGGKQLKLNGRNLRSVVEALLTGTCEFVAELAEGQTVPEGAPVIESIQNMSPPKG
jgi:hypothetical protein